MVGPRAMELMRDIHPRVCHLAAPGSNPQFTLGLALLHKVNIKDLMSHAGLG